MNTPSEWLRAPETCDYLKISRRTLSAWQRKRLLSFYKPAPKVGLFLRADLDKAMMKFQVKGVTQ